MAVISLFGSLLLIGFALWTMWATIAPSFARMISALNSASPMSPLPAYQRRPHVVAVRARFSRPALRAAA